MIKNAWAKIKDTAMKVRVVFGSENDYWSQLIVWLATSALFPAAVFFGFVLAGGTFEAQVGQGEMLLVAAALTAPILGALITLPGLKTVGRSLLFFSAFMHVTVTIFYYAGIKAQPGAADSIPGYSLWLYGYAVIVGAMAAVVSTGARLRVAERACSMSRVANLCQMADDPEHTTCLDECHYDETDPVFPVGARTQSQSTQRAARTAILRASNTLQRQWGGRRSCANRRKANHPRPPSSGAQGFENPAGRPERLCRMT